MKSGLRWLQTLGFGLVIGTLGCGTAEHADESIAEASVIAGLRDRGPLEHLSQNFRIALDPQGRLNVVGSQFNDDHTASSVEHGVYFNNAWHWSVIEKSRFLKLVGGFAIDGQGALHVAYSDGFVEDQAAVELTYATRSAGGGWTRKAIDIRPIPPCHAAGTSPCEFVTIEAARLLLDSQQRPHVLYSLIGKGTAEGRIVHAVRGRLGWSLEATGVTGAVGTPDSVTAAIDAADQIHLATPDADETSVLYAVRRAAGWTSEVVVSDLDVGRVSLAVDTAGRAHVAVGDFEGVRVFRRNNARFVELPVAPSVNFIGGDVKLAIDAGNKLHLFSQNGALVDNADPFAGLRYARFDGVRWSPLQLISNDGSRRVEVALRGGTAHVVADEHHAQSFETTYFQLPVP